MKIKLTNVFFYHRKRLLINIMRTFILLLCTTVFGFTSKTAFSQNAKVVINADMEVTIDQVFTIIKQQTNYRFIYHEDLFKNAPKVHLEKGVTQVNKLLKESLSANNYKIEFAKNNSIVVTPITIPKTLNSVKKPQEIKIFGTVKDPVGLTLPGVTILIKSNTPSVVITDLNGLYSITVPSEQTILVFSYIGFESQEITVGKQTEINVTMEVAVSKLDDLVINTGYQKIKPEQSTGSISTIRAKEYNSRINTTDFLTGLQNKIPGLVINNDVKFEGNSLFQIRGISTINGNKQALIVVDGFPTELSLDMINPNDIESVTVLKDAAAATIYGARSSNGVIIIERKKAKIGKVNVNFRTTTSLTPKENFNRYRWDRDGSNTAINYDRTYYQGSISSTTWADMHDPDLGLYYNYPAPGLIMAQEVAGVITTEEANQRFAALGAYNNSKDYSHLFLQTAQARTYNVDVSGGNDQVLYYITANYINNDASQIKNNNNQFNLSGRTTIKLSNRFSVDLTTDYQKGVRNIVSIPNINDIYPYERFQDNNGNPLPLFNGSNANPYYNNNLIAQGLLDNMYYPLIDINEVSDENKIVNNRINANFRYKIANGLNVNFGGVYESSLTDDRHLANENSSEVHQYVNYYTQMGNNGLVFNLPRGGFLQQKTASAQGHTLRAQLNYDKNISENHSLNLIAGTEVRSIVSKSNSAAYFGYNDQTLSNRPVDYYTLLGKYFQPNFAGYNTRLSYNNLFNQEYKEDRFFSVYSNVVYSYMQKYSLTGSYRIDQSNLFGTDPKYKYKPLWSLGAAWNINNENFMRDINWIKSLKLRTAYGINGNVAKNSLPRTIAANGLNNFDNTIPTLYLLSPANSKLRWEQTSNFNLGLDYNIFKNITGSIDYYIKKSTDILANQQTDPGKGVTSALINQASIQNKGLEIGLHADWISHENFNWNTGLIFTNNESKVLEVYNVDIPQNGYSYNYIYGAASNYLKGNPVGAMFSYRYAGVDNTGEALIYDKDGNKKHLFENDKGLEDLEYSGTSIPVYSMGLSNRVDIGNFYVYAMINYYGGFKVRVPVPNPSAIRPLEGANNYWKQPGDEADPNILPALQYRNSTEVFIRSTDKYTVNGDYITLGDLTASYSLKNSSLKKSGITSLELGLQASNVYTIAFNKHNFSSATGSYEKSYLTPTYTLSLNINF